MAPGVFARSRATGFSSGERERSSVCVCVGGGGGALLCNSNHITARFTKLGEIMYNTVLMLIVLPTFQGHLLPLSSG